MKFNLTLHSLIIWGTLLVGYLCFFGALIAQWIEVPEDFMDGEVVCSKTSVSFIFKLVITVLLGLSALGIWFKQSVFAYLGILITIVLLTFPAFLLRFEPELSGQASWLQQQHKNLSWLGGDVFTAQEERLTGNYRDIYVVDNFRFNSVVTIPKSIPSLLQWGRLAEWIVWAGFTDAFCQFVSKGWFLAWMGSVCFWIFGIRATEDLSILVMSKSLILWILCLAIPISITITSITGSAWSIGKAHTHFQKGNYQQAERYLLLSSDFLPVLKQDSFFIIQQGIIHRKLGFQTPQAGIYQAFLLEKEGLYQQSQKYFERIALQTDPGSGYQREAVRGLLRSVIHDWNSHQLLTAERRLNLILELDPCSLKANYVGQLIHLRNENLTELESLVTRMETVYPYFNALSPKPVIAMARDNLKYARLNQKTEHL
ncbi:MAG: hypothetical protein AAF558_09275 [Verrucomicrobiota bacterium]